MKLYGQGKDKETIERETNMLLIAAQNKDYVITKIDKTGEKQILCEDNKVISVIL